MVLNVSLISQLKVQMSEQNWCGDQISWGMSEGLGWRGVVLLHLVFKSLPWDPVGRTEWTQWIQATRVIKLFWIIWSSQYSFQWEYWAIHLPEWGHSDKFSNYQNVLLQNVDSLVLWKIQHFRSDCEFCKCRTAARTGWSLAWVKPHFEAGSRWILQTLLGTLKACAEK